MRKSIGVDIPHMYSCMETKNLKKNEYQIDFKIN
jgi:hypothetical protein